jgi:hypothetical protein
MGTRDDREEQRDLQRDAQNDSRDGTDPSRTDEAASRRPQDNPFPGDALDSQGAAGGCRADVEDRSRTAGGTGSHEDSSPSFDLSRVLPKLQQLLLLLRELKKRAGTVGETKTDRQI